MAYTASQLITRAYYLSQVVSRDLQTVSADQIEDGLYLLNALLDIKGSDLRLIPYFTFYEFQSVPGQEIYFIPNLLYVDTMTFNLQTVRYSMTEMTRYNYFATPRIDNIQTLPFSWRSERVLGGMNIYLYFLPNEAYTMKLMGKFGFGEVALDTDLTQTYDLYYIEYLRYAVAEYICAEYGSTFPAQSVAKYAEIRKKLLDVSPPDLSLRKQTYFSSSFPIDWQTVNLSNGYFPF